MDEERKRILQMLKEGSITVEECDELLGALSSKKDDKEIKPRAEPAPGKPSAIRPPQATGYVPSSRARSLLPWLIVWLVLVGLTVAVPTILYMTMGAGHGGPQMVDGPRGMSTVAATTNGDFHTVLEPTIFLPVVLIVLLMGIFWFWMLIDCLVRDHRDFGVIFANDTSIDKVIWLLLILFTSLIGAIAYHIAVRRRRRPELQPNPCPRPDNDGHPEFGDGWNDTQD